MSILFTNRQFDTQPIWLALCRSWSLARTVGDAALAQVVRRQLDAYLVASENTDVVLAHLSGDVRGYDVPVFQLHAEHGVGQGVDDSTFHFEAVFFRHAVEPSDPVLARRISAPGKKVAPIMPEICVSSQCFQLRVTQRWFISNSMGRYCVL